MMTSDQRIGPDGREGIHDISSDDNRSLSLVIRSALLPAAISPSLDRSWFLVIVLYGGVGEGVISTPTGSGAKTIEAPLVSPFDAELFLFLNDATLGFPGSYDIFYRDNKAA
jgi:hypothetical protein